jgi:hypothetical protein
MRHPSVATDYNVHIRLVGDGAQVDIFPDAKTDSSSTLYATENDIPPWIRDKIAVLKLLPEDGFIPGVGYRTMQGEIFWILNDPRKTSEDPGSTTT